MHLICINVMVALLLLLLLTPPSRTNELLELACTTDAQCAQFDGGHCVNMGCACTARDSNVTVVCRPHEEKLTNIIGGPCPCPQPNSECDGRRDQCACHVGYLPSADRRRCLPAAVRYGDECEFMRQCQLADKFSTCMKGQCLCRAKFEFHQGRCLAVLQSNCRFNTDCGTCDATLCLPGLKKCACAENYVHNSNMSKCITGSAYGDSCDNSAPCQVNLGGSGQCQDHRCTCRPTHYPKRVANAIEIDEEDSSSHKNRISCEPIVSFGAYCRHNDDCQMKPLDQTNAPAAMVCQWGECRCSDTTHQLQDNQCIPVVNTGAKPPTAASRGFLLGFVCTLQILFITLIKV